MRRRQLLTVWAALVMCTGIPAGAQEIGAGLEEMIRAYLQYPEGIGPAGAAGETPIPVAGRVRYESRYLDGVFFQLGTVDGLLVGIALHRQSSLAAGVFVFNASNQPVTFRPAEIRVDARKRGRAVPLRTFSAEEGEEKDSGAQAVDEEPGGPTDNSSSPPSTTSSGGGKQIIFYGTPCSEPGSNVFSEKDCAGGWTRPMISSDDLQARPAAAAEVPRNLAEDRRLAPGGFYGGMVHIEKKKAHTYLVSVPLGGETFSFAFRCD